MSRRYRLIRCLPERLARCRAAAGVEIVADTHKPLPLTALARFGGVVLAQACHGLARSAQDELLTLFDLGNQARQVRLGFVNVQALNARDLRFSLFD